MAALLLAVGCGDVDTSAADAVCEDPFALDAQEAVELYMEAWSEEDSSERACMIQRSLADDAVLIATTSATQGRFAVARDLDERITLLLDETTNRDPAGAIVSRHDEARLPWVVTNRDGMELERGEDWLEFDEDGLLSRIHILAGTGTDAPVSAPLRAWQRAWNADDEASRSEALNDAATEDVRFTDLLTDIRGRDALGVEIGRQHDALNAELRLEDRVEVFASAGNEPILLRVAAQLVLPQGDPIHVVDYLRLREGRIERLSGFPSPAP